MSMDSAQGADRHEEVTPEPDDPRKPDSPGDLHKPTWGYSLKGALREFSDDQCTDLAAALTYYAVLAIFPAAIALVSILGVIGQTDAVVKAIEDVLAPLVKSQSTIDTVTGVIEGISGSGGAPLALVLGLLGALWSASGYVNAFSRAMNRVYEIGEGRPIWKLRPTMLLVTLVLLILVALVVLMIAVSGPVAESVGDAIGLGSTAQLVWNIAKWPVVLLFVVLIIAMLYYFTPNVQQPKFRWMSIGAFIALLMAVLAVAAFSFYAANLGSYNKTYGSLAGAVLLMLVLWLINVALLFGAEVDSEMERGRQLQAGMEAEKELQLPARDTRNIEKSEKKEQKAMAKGREIREDAEARGAALADDSSERSGTDSPRSDSRDDS